MPDSTFMKYLTPQLMEASNASLLIVQLCMLGGALIYLFVEWRELGSIGCLYRQRKAGIAFSVFITALTIRTFTVWILRYLDNHHAFTPEWAKLYAPLALIAATVGAVIAGMCWLRVTLPRTYGHRVWIVLSLAAIAFGVVTAAV